LDVNFLITKNNKTLNNEPEFKFWKVLSVEIKKENIYKLKLDLDIFFTYDIKNIFNKKKLEIANAHFDRFQKVKVDGKTKYTPNFDLTSPNITGEPFDGSIKDGNFIPYAGINLEYDYSHLYSINLSDEQKRMLNIGLNNMQSIIC